MRQRFFLFLFSAIAMINCSAQVLELAKAGSSVYRIFLPAKPSKTEMRAAAVLRDYFTRVTGTELPVVKEDKINILPGIFIGNSSLLNRNDLSRLPDDGFIIRTIQKNILIAGNGPKGSLYAVYEFIEKYLGCRKWDGGPAYTPKLSTLTIPAHISQAVQPLLKYREIYLPAAFNDEYLDWHKLQRFETIWGLWGHSFFKLVPPDEYYQSHPEYFSLVDQRRQPMQLCLSNPDVLKLTIARLTKLMQDNPEAQYWSVSPNDDIGNCECDHCQKLDAAEGGPQGSLLHFVNALASRFPKKIITMLAYGYTARAPVRTSAASNVAIMLSSIDAYRSQPLETENSAAAFRNDLVQWKTKANNIFVWDYCTQFTNYLTPFPVVANYKPNIDYLLRHAVSGIFEQGSGDTHSDMAELNAYLFAKLSWNPAADAESIINEFLQAYYGKAAPVIAEYLQLLQTKIRSSATHLDIYGNPVNDHNGYLSPENMDLYSLLMDKAEQLVENHPQFYSHVQALRFSHEFVVLQQAKFFGKDQHGIFRKNGDGKFVTHPGLPTRVARFVGLAEELGVKEFSEGGIGPAKYAIQWNKIFAAGPGYNLAANASVKIIYPFAPEYPAKKERTLVDETRGYEDFSYNWLCFYGVPMEVTVDLGSAKKVNSVRVHFLEDARHWIFRPSAISIETSVDGLHFQPLDQVTYNMPGEDYSVNFLPVFFSVNNTIRYLRVKAANWPALPPWRFHKYKKPMIACDEIWVE